MKTPHVTLPETDRTTLTEMLAHGTLPARTYKRAMALLALDRGETLTAVAERLQVRYDTVGLWRDAYRKDGLTMLHDAPRSGRPVRIDGTQQAKITALACSEAPEGQSQWSLRLLADKIVEAGFCETISHTQVGKILKKTT